tara:strand:+ start:3050 stop:3613 length:564 start_codon:yes stop_codon:yes gene_type:complete
MSVTNSVSGFLNKVKQGVRPNMFRVDIAFPGDDSAKQNLASYMCKSAALPASNVGVIEVPFRGRTVKIAGDRTFDNWSATFINDEDMKIRAFFEDWMRQMNSHESNVNEVIDPTVYGKHLFVHQMEKDEKAEGKVLRTYKLWYAFPTSSSAIDLAYDSNDQIEEFSVEFQYSYWTVENAGEAGITVA